MTNVLKKFHADINGIKKIIFLADWTSQQGICSLRSNLRNTAARLVENLSKKKSRKEFVKKNIIESSLEDLTIWKVWLKFEKFNKNCSFGELQDQVIAQLPEGCVLVDLLEHLLFEENKPLLRMTNKVFKEKPSLMLDAQRGIYPKKKIKIKKVLNVFSNEISKEPNKVLEWMINCSKQEDLIDKFSFKSVCLTNSEFRALLYKHPEGKLLMDDSLYKRLSKRPESIPESPFMLRMEKIKDQVLQEILRNNFSCNSIYEWLKYPKLVKPWLSKISEILIDDTYYERNGYLNNNAISLLKTLNDEPVLWAFLFIGIKPKLRLELFELSDYSTCLNAFNFIKPCFLQEMLSSLLTYHECRSAFRELKKYGFIKTVITRKFLDSITGENKVFERYWYLFSDKHSCSEKVEPTVKNAANLLTGNPNESELLKELFNRFSLFDKTSPWDRRNMKVSDHQKTDTFWDEHEASIWMNPLKLKRLLRGGETHQNLLIEAIRFMRINHELNWMNKYLPEVVKADIGFLYHHFKREFSQKEWLFLASKNNYWKQIPEAVSDFCKHVDFKTWDKLGFEIPKALWQQLNKDKIMARWAYHTQDQDKFWELAVKVLPWWERIPKSVADPILAKKLEAEIPENQWVEGTEFIKSYYPPNISAAMELSLIFGIRYGSFLFNIVKHLNLGSDDSVTGKECDSHYKTYSIPKQSGGKRLITAPSKTLKYFQRSLLDKVMNNWELEDCATGFRPGYGLLDNALPHVKKRIVVNVDIKGFFPNTKFPLILNVFYKKFDNKLSPRAIRLLAVLCSYNGSLPTGAPCSPAIANQVLSHVDRSIIKTAQKYQVSYTRYADDLTLSGNGHNPVKLLPFVEQVLEKSGYQLDSKKTNFFRKGRRQCVTGLVVNQKPNLAKPLRRRLRAAVHHFINDKPTSWYDKPMSLIQLKGRIGFLALTQPCEAAKLREKIANYSNSSK